MMTERVKTVRMKPDGTNYTGAAGSTAMTSDILDTQGFDGVRLLVAFGAIVGGAATSIKVQEDTDAAGGTMADVADTSQTVADTDDNKVFIVEIYRPRKRYLRVVTSRATQNATVDALLAELFKKQGLIPITQHATIGGTPEIFASPAEGTA